MGAFGKFALVFGGCLLFAVLVGSLVWQQVSPLIVSGEGIEAGAAFAEEHGRAACPDEVLRRLDRCGDDAICGLQAQMFGTGCLLGGSQGDEDELCAGVPMSPVGGQEWAEARCADRRQQELCQLIFVHVHSICRTHARLAGS